MERLAFILLAPPVAVPHYSDATATAAPIAVFWLAGLIGLIYGLTAGSGYSALAGLALYAVAVAWAEMVIQGVAEDELHHPDSPRDHTVALEDERDGPNMGDL